MSYYSEHKEKCDKAQKLWRGKNWHRHVMDKASAYLKQQENYLDRQRCNELDGLAKRILGE